MLLDIYHIYWQSPPAYGHEIDIEDLGNGYGHGYDRAERVRPNIFWAKTNSVYVNPIHLGSEDHDDIIGADRA